MSYEGTVSLSSHQRNLAIWAILIALFLGALDALIVSAAMPTIVAELGELSLFSWVYSSYFLSRAVSLPVFGKLADRYDSKNLFLVAIILFILSSTLAGLANSMVFLIFSRLLQGIGAGGIFALVYILLSQIAPDNKRAQTLSLGSTIWGISSVIGPTLGGFIVSYFSWRWIFLINIPIGLLSLAGVKFFLHLPSNKKQKNSSLDLLGLFMFSCAVLGLLTIFTIGGREIAVYSKAMFLLAAATVIAGVLFYFIEKRASDPVVDFHFFTVRNFCMGNAAIFLASFTIFSFFAYGPLYLQGTLGLNPLQVGIAMVSLSLGWSFGALFFGRLSSGDAERGWAMAGGVILSSGSLLTLGFDLDTSMAECFFIFFVVGIGMGFVSLATLILVQNSVGRNKLGIATSLHQFGRSLGGTIGVGICGGIVTTRFYDMLNLTAEPLPQTLLNNLQHGIENILLPEFQATIPPEMVDILRTGLHSGVFSMFIVTSIASLLCLLCCVLLSKPSRERGNE